jgi:hypothetical protein
MLSAAMRPRSGLIAKSKHPYSLIEFSFTRLVFLVPFVPFVVN